jgi:putative ABC transport system substrate-binding protein
MTLLLLALSPLCHAAQVVIVLSSDAQPYLKAQDALNTQLAGPGYTSRAIALHQLQKSKLNTVISKDTRVFVAIGTPAAKWLHMAIKPPFRLLYCMVADPAGAGLNKGVPALGITTDVPLPSQFEIMAEALPNARSVGLLYRSGTDSDNKTKNKKKQRNKDSGNKTKNSKSEMFLKTAKATLPQDWRLEAVAINKYESSSQAIQELLKRDIDIVWVYPDRSVYSLVTLRSLLQAATQEKKPVFSYSKGVVKAGSLLGTAIDPEKQGYQAAELVNRLLSSGINLKMKTPEPPQYEIAVNLFIARQIGVELPAPLLKRAKYIYKPQ